MKKVAIIGGAGFIGSFISSHFARKTDAKIVVIDRIDPAASLAIVQSNGLEDRHILGRMIFLRCNIDQGISEEVKEQLEGVDLVVHAAMTDIDSSRITKGPLENNFFAFLNVLEWVSSKAPEVQLILLSSAQAKLDPPTPSGASALGLEALLSSFAALRGFPYTIARVGNVFGEGQQPDRFIPSIIKNAENGEKIVVRKVSGFVPVRGWTHALNVADAILTMATADQVKTAGETFEVVGERPSTDLDIARSVVFILGVKAEIALSEEDAGPGARLNLSGFKMKEKLEWSPPFMLSDALIRTVQLTAKGSKE